MRTVNNTMLFKNSPTWYFYGLLYMQDHPKTILHRKAAPPSLVQ